LGRQGAGECYTRGSCSAGEFQEVAAGEGLDAVVRDVDWGAGGVQGISVVGWNSHGAWLERPDSVGEGSFNATLYPDRLGLNREYTCVGRRHSPILGKAWLGALWLSILGQKLTNHRERGVGISTFDTLKFVRRLEQAGVSTQQAEAQAEVLTEAFNVNLEDLVTKDFLAARLAELKADFDAKFRVQTVMISIILAAVVIPLLQELTT
jgi:hypothetical protein